MRYLPILVVIGIMLIASCGQEQVDPSGNEASIDTIDSSNSVLFSAKLIIIKLDFFKVGVFACFILRKEKMVNGNV